MTKNSRENNVSFYQNKRVLITGHTGFKGAWMTTVLNYLQAEAEGYALSPVSGCLYEKIDGDNLIKSVIGNVLDFEKLQEVVMEFQPEIVFHFAALAFVNECYNNPLQAYETNIMGTVNLLEILRNCDSVKSIVVVTTDKVYENKGDGAIYCESDLLGGLGPYSGSKTCVEFLVNDYRETFFGAKEKKVGIATVRASNVLGGGDNTETRLIPTILRAVANSEPVEIRNPDQTRPWQSVLDALNGYLTVARFLYFDPVKYSRAWNIGPNINGIRRVSWIYDKIKESFYTLQCTTADLLEVNESKTLGLNIEQALQELDWEPVLPIEKTIEQVVDFFKCQMAGENEKDICMRQICDFFSFDKVDNL